MKLLKHNTVFLTMIALACSTYSPGYADSAKLGANYKIVDTGQVEYFNNSTVIPKPSKGQPFYGQDTQYMGNQPSYSNNGDGTVTDNVTGLMWQQSFDHNGDGKINVKDKLTYSELIKQFGQGGVTFGKYNDWRLPTIKEAYSLILYSGRDTAPESTSSTNHIPFIDNKTFAFAYGDIAGGERLIDMQVATTTLYVSKEVPATVFGVNFADGRIKGYGIAGLDMPSKQDKTFNYILVRGNPAYGVNHFVDNTDGTITDKATGLMWMQDDNGKGLLWKDALAYAESKEFAGYSDWRLPNPKELQSIVDYERSPDTTQSAAIDPIFKTTQITNEAGEADYPWYWTSTTHVSEKSENNGEAAIYVSFGRSLGNMPESFGKPENPSIENGSEKGQRPPPPQPGQMQNQGQQRDANAPANWVDIHGAGSQRSDPKTGNPNDYAMGDGPQGDAKRIYNFIRLVRDVK